MNFEEAEEAMISVLEKCNPGIREQRAKEAEWEASFAAKAKFTTILCMPEHELYQNLSILDHAIEGVKSCTTQKHGMNCDLHDNKPDKKRKLDHVAGISDIVCPPQPTQPTVHLSSDIQVMDPFLHGDSKGLPDLNKDDPLHLINQVHSTPLASCTQVCKTMVLTPQIT